LSKIIKASHLIVICDEKAAPQESSKDGLTKENMEMLYQEAKIMVEDLINESKAKAERIIFEANCEAKKILKSANKEADEIKSKAHLEGLEKGKEIGQAKVEDLKNLANDIIQKAYAERKNLLAQMEGEIIDFALKLAEKIIRSQLENKPEVTQNIIEDLLRIVQDSTQVTVKLSTADYEQFRHKEGELKSILNKGLLNIEADCTLNKGDCIVVSETGIVTAKINDQLEKLKEVLREVESFG